MKKPPYLKKGDTIALVAPSFGCVGGFYESRLRASIECLEKKGYKISIGKNVFREVGRASSAPAKERAEEFMEAYRSDASLILSVGGGELMCEILPEIDFEEIKRLPPKWFMGFSDNTNLTFTLTTICDIETIYGPCAPQFYSLPFRYNVKDSLRMLSGARSFSGYEGFENFRPRDASPLRECVFTDKKVIKAFNYNGPIRGTLLGGCLDCLVGLVGTPFDNVKKFCSRHKEGIIWYLECCDLNPLAIRRALGQLKNAGWFSNANAFLIGRPLCRDSNMFNIEKYNAVLGVLSDMNLPFLMDIDLGHIPPSMPIKNGAKAVVSFEEGNIHFLYKNKI